MRTLLFSFITLILLSGFSIPVKKKDNSRVLLIVRDVMNKEHFSLFSVEDKGGVLIGTPIDLDYPVEDGIYRIEGASNDDFYHKKIIVLS